MTDAEINLLVRQLADVAGKLLFETERLRRDVVKLHGRIEPFDGEIAVPNPGRRDAPIRNLPEAVEVLGQARNAVVGCEYHLSTIRGLMDNIASDAISRSEMKPFLKEASAESQGLPRRPRDREPK